MRTRMNPLTLTDLAHQVTRKMFAQFRFPILPTLLQILQEENPFFSTNVYFMAKFIFVCSPFRRYAQTNALSVQMDYIIKHHETSIQITTPRNECMDEHYDTFVEILCPLPALCKFGIFGVSENFFFIFFTFTHQRGTFFRYFKPVWGNVSFSFELLLTPKSSDRFCQSAHKFGIQLPIMKRKKTYETFAIQLNISRHLQNNHLIIET